MSLRGDEGSECTSCELAFVSGVDLGTQLGLSHLFGALEGVLPDHWRAGGDGPIVDELAPALVVASVVGTENKSPAFARREKRKWEGFITGGNAPRRDRFTMKLAITSDMDLRFAFDLGDRLALALQAEFGLVHPSLKLGRSYAEAKIAVRHFERNGILRPALCNYYGPHIRRVAETALCSAPAETSDAGTVLRVRAPNPWACGMADVEAYQALVHQHFKAAGLVPRVISDAPLRLRRAPAFVAMWGEPEAALTPEDALSMIAHGEPPPPGTFFRWTFVPASGDGYDVEVDATGVVRKRDLGDPGFGATTYEGRLEKEDVRWLAQAFVDAKFPEFREPAGHAATANDGTVTAAVVTGASAKEVTIHESAFEAVAAVGALASAFAALLDRAEERKKKVRVESRFDLWPTDGGEGSLADFFACLAGVAVALGCEVAPLATNVAADEKRFGGLRPYFEQRKLGGGLITYAWGPRLPPGDERDVDIAVTGPRGEIAFGRTRVAAFDGLKDARTAGPLERIEIIVSAPEREHEPLRRAVIAWATLASLADRAGAPFTAAMAESVALYRGASALAATLEEGAPARAAVAATLPDLVRGEGREALKAALDGLPSGGARDALLSRLA